MKLFGTSGVRGDAEVLFTNEFSVRLGYTFASWLKLKNKQGNVAVACDPRESSPRIRDHMCQGVAGAGYSIINLGVIPTPAITYFTKKTPGIAGGFIVTGSHITTNLNGVKFFVDGEEITKDYESEIEAAFARNSLPKRAYPYVEHQNSGFDIYLELLYSLARPPYPNWRIVVDTANGTQTNVMRQLFSDLGLEWACTDYCDIQSPNFSARDTEKPTDYHELSRQVLLQHADFGVGFDLDGDRVIFIDEQGKFIPGDLTCSIIAKYSDSPSFVTPVSSSSAIDSLDKPVHRTPVGSTHVAARMKTVGSKFGFEANGGAISAELHYGRDGGTTFIKLINILKSQNCSFSTLMSELPRLSLFRDKVDCPFDRYNDIYTAVLEKYSQSQIDKTDGVKVFLGHNEWILFRGSGNAPEFRIMVESSNSRKAEHLGQEALFWVKTIIVPTKLSTRTIQRSVDTLHILDAIKAFPDQCEQVISEISQQQIPSQCSLVQNVVISGMGGSALGGRIVSGLEREALRIPIVVSTEYHLPAFVNENTLVVISSYSGNTEETLSSLKEAITRKAQIFVLASGGKLSEYSQFPNYIFNPKNNPSHQPRMGLGYNILALIGLLSRCQLIHPPKDIPQLVSFLRTRQSGFAQIEKLAKSLAGKIPVLIASEHLKGPAHAVKNMINENAKSMSMLFDLPEADHHLIEGLSFPVTNSANLGFVFIPSPHYHAELFRRYDLTQSLIDKQHISTFTLTLGGKSRFLEAMDLIQAGAYLSFCLSQVYGVDPGPIPWVDWLKDKQSAHEISTH